MRNYQIVCDIEKGGTFIRATGIEGFNNGKRILDTIGRNLDKSGWETLKKRPRKIVMKSKTGAKQIFTLEGN